MNVVLAVAAWLIAVAAAIVVGTWEPPVALLAAALVGLAAVAVFVLWRAYCARSPARAALSVVFYAWLYGVPVLLGIGLVRRLSELPELFSLGEAQDYASRTDLFLWLGLLLNALLPVTGLLFAWTVERSRVKQFGRVTIGAVLIYLLIAFVGSQSNAGLFGHLPRWEKPRSVAVDECRRRRRPSVTP